MNGYAQQDNRTVSFLDDYLIPCIERCINSRRMTCGCSIVFVSLATFCFFATIYMINYPVTEAWGVAFVFAAVFFLVAATGCLQLRFRIFNECRDAPEDNALFEVTRRDDTVFSDSFELQEGPFFHGPSREGPRQAEAPDDSPSAAHSVVESHSARISTVGYNGGGHLPRYSISDCLPPDAPLLLRNGCLELSRPPRKQNGIRYQRLEWSGIVPGCHSYPRNYSTFGNSDFEYEIQPLLAEFTSENGSDTSDTETLSNDSKSESCRDKTETVALQTESTFASKCDGFETEPFLADSTVENGCKAPESPSLSPDTTFKNGGDAPKSQSPLSKHFNE